MAEFTPRGIGYWYVIGRDNERGRLTVVGPMNSEQKANELLFSKFGHDPSAQSACLPTRDKGCAIGMIKARILESSGASVSKSLKPIKHALPQKPRGFQPSKFTYKKKRVR